MASEVIAGFPAQYRSQLLLGQRKKLGVRRDNPQDDDGDRALIDDWLAMLHTQHIDFTLAWRRLAETAAGNEAPLRALFRDRPALDSWLARWRGRCAEETVDAIDSTTAVRERARLMRSVNPIVIARNHHVEEALAAASEQGDLAPFERLLDAIKKPYDELRERTVYAEPAPADVTACYRTYCGT